MLERARRVVLVADVVESVRLVDADEAGFVTRWLAFARFVTEELLAPAAGRVVKSLGDGLLIEFKDVHTAVAAAVRMHAHTAHGNAGQPAERAILLRIGIHLADILVDQLDIFGAGVNLAYRVAAMAEPGTTFLTAQARDQLATGLDIEVEDMGERYGKHLKGPVRTFRVLVPSGRETSAALPSLRQPDRLSVAVIPFDGLGCGPEYDVLGEWIADAVIDQLTKTPELLVFSRLGTTGLRGRVTDRSLAGERIGAHYLLTGRYTVIASRLAVNAELCLASSGETLWAERLVCPVAEVLEPHSEMLERISQQAHRAILDREAERAVRQPLPSLEAFTLLYGGIGLLHRSSTADFLRADQVLGALAERVPGHSHAHAWLAKWQVFSIVRGLTRSPGDSGLRARRHIDDALARDPDNALAWALGALVSGWVDHAPDQADQAVEKALDCNPNEPLAWLVRCAVHSWQGRGREAVHAAEHALSLSRLDPMRYYYQTLSAAGLLAGERPADAIALCQQSLRQNRLHTATYRVLAIAQVATGQIDEARRAVEGLLRLQPDYTASRFLSSYPGGQTAQAQAYAGALRAAGLPE